MQDTEAVLLRIFIGESDQAHGMPLYRYLVTFLRDRKFAGVTVLRGISGFGHRSIIHTSDLLDLSSDLPIVLEVVDTEEKINAFKQLLETEHLLQGGLVTEERVHVIRYGT